MHITFKNLGTVREATVDLRPLTVIIGPNNSSKTYIAYSIYGLFHPVRQERHMGPMDSTRNYESNSITLDENHSLQSLLSWLCNDFKYEIDTFFQNSNRKLFAKTTFKIMIPVSEYRAAALQRGADIISGFSTPRWHINEEPDRLRFEFNNALDHAPGFRERANEIVDLLLWEAFQSFFPTPLLFPAERNAFIITYKILAHRRFQFLRSASRDMFIERESDMRRLQLLREQGDLRYPQPIEDFLDFLTEVELAAGGAAYVSPEQAPFHALADDIETKLQGNSQVRLKPTRLGGRELQVTVRKGLNIDLYNASSSIKQLTPLLLYLRYRARPNDFIIIDEPEMNLHPESQARFLEILGILVNLGVRVLITTHSPYFMAHLNNLVSGKKEDPELLERQAKTLYLQDSRAFLSMDQVSAYEMKGPTLHSLKDPDYGIRWDTLSDVSAELQQKYFELASGAGSDGEE